MQGQDNIENIDKAVLMWKEKGNEVIDRLNNDWYVDMPDPQCGTVEFKGSDGECRLDMSQANVVQVGCCLRDGTKKILNVPFAWLSDPE